MRITSSVVLCGLLFLFGAKQDASAANYFNWGAESNTTSNGAVLGYFSNTTRDCTVSHTGSCSLRLNVQGNDGGNGGMGADVNQNPYGWNVVGSQALYYRWWMKIQPGFNWGSATAKTKSSRVIAGSASQGYTGYLMSYGFLIGECDSSGCTLNNGGSNSSDSNLVIPYDFTSRADGVWHEYIVRIKPNTSAGCTAPSTCDAQFQAWVDGVSVGQYNNFKLHNNGANSMTEAWGGWMVTPYFQLNATASDGGTIYVDDFSTDDVYNSLIVTSLPVVTFSATPASISSGASATLTWSSTNASTCAASGAWSGRRSTANVFTVSPATTSTYTLTCTGAGGSAAQSVTVTVVSAPPPPSTVNIGEQNVLATNDSGNGGLLLAQQTTLATTATIQSLSFYVTTPGGDLRLGIYDATGPGAGPGAKRAETSSFTPVAGWNTANVITPVSLPAGVYWLAYFPSSSTLGFRVDTTGSARWYSYPYGVMPNTFSTTPTSGAYHWSFYATLSAVAAPPDITPPSVPANPTASAVSSSQINLSWSASSDNVGVTGYKVYRNGTQITTTATNSFNNVGLAASTTYSYTISSYDAAGNESAQSSSVSATTLASGPPPSNTPFTTTVIEAGQAYWSKGVGDIDGDGQLDIITARDGAGGNVYWFKYPSWTKYTIGSVGGDDDLKLGDINNDGALDVVVNGGTYWYENPRGSGGNVQALWVRHTIDAANNGHDLVLRDVNGDGKLDVLTRGEFGATTLYIQGATSDTWTAIPMPNAPNGEGSALADINGDGRIDIVGNGYWLQQPASNITSGAAWIRRDFGAWPTGASVGVADINNDGRPDIFLAASEVGAGNLSWFEAPVDTINGVWIRHDIANVEDIHRFHLVDINKDGNLDIVFAEMHQSASRRVGVYYNNGNGASWTLQTIATTGSHNIAVGDIGGDGDIDIVGANWSTSSPDGGALNLWRNDAAPSAPYKVLVFSKTTGFRHASIPAGIAAIQSLGTANGFTADATEDAALFTDANLAQYKALIFLNPSGNILNAAEQGALQRFIQAGKGFVGVHNATALLDPTMDAWTWYQNMLGAKYQSEISTQAMCLQVLDTTHISSASLPNPWCFTEEAYNFDQNPKTLGATVLLNLDETSISNGTMGADHPFSWYKIYDGGRMWYTLGGANETDYANTNFRLHLLGGIKYAAGI